MLVDSRQRCDEDTACVYPILLCAESIRIIDTCQYHYVRRMNSISTQATGASEYFDAVKYVYERLKEEFLQYEEKDQLLEQLERLISSRVAVGMKKYFSLLINQYMFPYELIRQGSRIVLYGAGVIGRSFYKQTVKNKYCEVALWVDKDYENIDIQYAKIEEPKLMLQEEYDYVIVCVKSRQIAENIINNLRFMGIAEGKIVWKEDYMADLDVRFGR